MTVSGQDDARIRVSDAERDAVASRLRDHFETGRLTLDEFNDRVGETYSARTEADLQRALRELPVDATPPGPMARPGGRRGWADRRRSSGAITHFASVNGICIAIWAASGAGYFWPIWVLIPTAFILIRRLAGIEDDDRLGHIHERHRRRHERHRRRHESYDNHDRNAPAAGHAHVSPPAQRPSSDAPVGRVVMSVLFVDIVGSTERAAALGDAAWQAVVSRYERGVQAALRQYTGDTLFTKGDEVVAGFALPAAAVQCALRIRDEARAAGIEVRAGVHAGEVDRVGSQANGIAMHIGRRVCESAAPGQVLVSSTVHDLLAGSGIGFVGAGDHELKGLQGSWRLYEPSS